MGRCVHKWLIIEGEGFDCVIVVLTRLINRSQSLDYFQMFQTDSSYSPMLSHTVKNYIFIILCIYVHPMFLSVNQAFLYENYLKLCKRLFPKHFTLYIETILINLLKLLFSRLFSRQKNCKMCHIVVRSYLRNENVSLPTCQKAHTTELRAAISQ